MLTSPVVFKDVFETAALTVLYIAVALGIARYMFDRETFFLWFLAVCGILLFREFHFSKKDTTILYVLAAVLFVIAWLGSEKLSDYLPTPRVATLLAMMGMCYAASQILDFTVVRRLLSVFDILEEMVEVMGHCFAVLLVLIARPVGKNGACRGRETATQP